MLQPRVFNVQAAVKNSEGFLGRLIGENIELICPNDPGCGNVKTDIVQFEQVLINLVINARDAMPKGGVLTIEARNVHVDEFYAQRRIQVRPGDYVLLAVSDTGHGIDEKIMPHIFEPFFSTKDAKGTGLGLSTVYGIVKQSGGYVWAYSEPGKGSTFKVYLPQVDEPVTEADTSAVSASRGANETILLVEDDHMLRDLIARLLARKGFKVIPAADGAEALELIDAGTIHLLLTDVVMPGISGKELADRLHVRRPDLKVLYMSGYTEDAIIHHGVLNNGVRLLEKPFTEENLFLQVRDVIDNG